MANLPIKQGQTFKYLGTMKDPDLALFDLTGSTMRGSIKIVPTDTEIPFTFEIRDQVTHKGEFYAIMDASVTATIPVRPFKAPNRPTTSYLGDFEIIFTDLTVYRFYEFIADVSPEVTTNE